MNVCPKSTVCLFTEFRVYVDSALVGSHGSKLGTEAGVNFHSMQMGDWSAVFLARIFKTIVAMS